MTSSKILIPVDGSPASLRALDFAIQRLVRGGGDLLVLLHVQNSWVHRHCRRFGCDARLRY